MDARQRTHTLETVEHESEPGQPRNWPRERDEDLVDSRAESPSEVLDQRKPSGAEHGLVAAHAAAVPAGKNQQGAALRHATSVAPSTDRSRR